ncbi:MAG: hypothetical protein KAI80_05110, partial [Hyphomicrobiaceae bacterium]|nr:hypothetical protein [Hyphomicrobiaceae bacterium]
MFMNTRDWHKTFLPPSPKRTSQFFLKKADQEGRNVEAGQSSTVEGQRSSHMHLQTTSGKVDNTSPEQFHGPADECLSACAGQSGRDCPNP